MELIASVDRWDLSQAYNIKSEDDDYCFIKIYPSSADRFGMYAIISAKGPVFSQGVKITLSVIASIIVLIFTAAFIKVIISRIK